MPWGAIMDDYVPGFYGKLPILGDFVSRRLPASFIRDWDEWIQESISASKKELDANWLKVYLTSPIWRFVLSPGSCGDRASTGILMPSVDKAGRYFPLTLAVMLDELNSLPSLFTKASDWFAKLEGLALSALESDIQLEVFDRNLQESRLDFSPPIEQSIRVKTGCNGQSNGSTVRIEMHRLEQIAEAYFGLCHHLMTRYYTRYSLWWTAGSELMQPSFLVYEGLPPAGEFCDLLSGYWQRCEDGKADTGMSSFSERTTTNHSHAPVFIDSHSDPAIVWRSAALTTAGKVREHNEDAYFENSENGIWAVADGMGGHFAGHEASQVVIETLKSAGKAESVEQLSDDINTRLLAANTELIRRARQKHQDQIMGSTVVVMLAVGGRCASLWAGDSRLYRYREGLLSQLTRDHSPASETGHLSETFISHDTSNVITCALGADPDLSIDQITFEAKCEDKFLLCSDGLTKEVSPKEISQILGACGCADATRSLIDLALSRKARDNVTVIVIAAEGH